MTDRELMKQALEALESLRGFHTCSGISCDGVITALREALAEQPAQQQEPVAEVKLMERGGNAGLATVIHEIFDPMREPLRVGDKLYTSPQPAQQEPVGKWMGDCIEWTENPYKFRKGQPIYTSPQPSKPWVGLTDDAILDMAEGCTAQYHDLLALARTIEAKLREKNK